MRRLICCISVLFFFIECNGINRNVHSDPIIADTTVFTAKALDLFWGIDNGNTVDTAKVLETAIYYLNRSAYRKAYTALSNKYLPDTVYTGGFSGFMPHAPNDTNKYVNYLFYRLNDYSGNVIGNVLSNELLQSAVDPKESLRDLQEVESFYDIVLKNKKIDDAGKLVSKLLILKKNKPEALRLDYLLLCQYIVVDDSINVLKTANILISKNYYVLPVLRNVITYLSRRGSPEVGKYLPVFEKKFPFECNLVKISRSLRTIREDTILYECKKCYQSTFQIDSIYARMALVEYYINNNKLSQAEGYIKEYMGGIENEPYDDKRAFVKGKYYDFLLRTFFIQKRYGEIREFIESKLQRNPVVVINDDDQFRLYIQKLYREYVTADTKNFDLFLRKNFSK
jgi:hypothetical protein